MSLVECVGDEIGEEKMCQVKTNILMMRNHYGQLVEYYIMILTDKERALVRNDKELNKIVETAEEEIMYGHYAV